MDGRFMGFSAWWEVVRTIDATRMRLYYVSPTLHDEGSPVSVSGRIIWRDAGGKAEQLVHVIPFLSQVRFAPFDADAAHLSFFRREWSELSISEFPRLPQVEKPFQVTSLPEPAGAPKLICEGCKLVYYALPFQSKHKCARCQPPRQICRHGMTSFQRCVACEQVTGSARPSLGLMGIKL